jgi:hypothetical protein
MWLCRLKPEAIQTTLSCYYTCRDSCNNYSTLIHWNKSHHLHLLGTDAYLNNTGRISQGLETHIFWYCCSNKLPYSNLLVWIFLTATSAILKKYCCLTLHCRSDLHLVWNYCSCQRFEKNSSNIYWLCFSLVRIFHLVHVFVHALASLD